MRYTLIALGIVILGGVAYGYSQGYFGSSSQFEATLVEVQQRGGSYECTISNHDFPQAQIDGMLYADNGNIRADYDFIVPSQEQTFEGHIIINEEYLYAWPQIQNSGETTQTGFRFPFEQYVAATTDPSHSLYQQLQIKYQFNCKRKSIGGVLFEAPEDVTFEDQDFD